MVWKAEQPVGEAPGGQVSSGALTGRTQFLWLICELKVVRVLLTLSAAFLLFSVAGQLLARLSPGSEALQSIARATNVDQEGNLPSLFNTVLLLLPAGLLGLIARAMSPVQRILRRGWGVLSLVFVYLSADEYLHLHELLMAPVRTLLQVGGFLHYAWVVPYAALGLILLTVLVPFLRALPPRSRRAIVQAGALYLTGALGLELVSGRVDVNLGVRNALVLPLTTLEEGLEMTGLSLFIGALLGYLRAHLPGVQLAARLAPPYAAVEERSV